MNNDNDTMRQFHNERATYWHDKVIEGHNDHDILMHMVMLHNYHKQSVQDLDNKVTTR